MAFHAKDFGYPPERVNVRFDFRISTIHYASGSRAIPMLQMGNLLSCPSAGSGDVESPAPNVRILARREIRHRHLEPDWSCFNTPFSGRRGRKNRVDSLTTRARDAIRTRSVSR